MNYSKIKKIAVFAFSLYLGSLCFTNITHGKDVNKNNNIIIIDKNKNSISIGGIDNDINGDEENVERETRIDNMLIINNDEKIYIKHSENDNKSAYNENEKK